MQKRNVAWSVGGFNFLAGEKWHGPALLLLPFFRTNPLTILALASCTYDT